jgi:hypothetical protein
VDALQLSAIDLYRRMAIAGKENSA